MVDGPYQDGGYNGVTKIVPLGDFHKNDVTELRIIMIYL